jgi:uncharacterized LabA/DUF88 family protein
MQFAVFVDGAAVHGTVAEQRGQIDFEKLRSIYLDRGDGLAVFNYFNVAVVEDNGSILMRPLLDRLDYIGWRMDVIETDRQIADGIRRSRQTILTSMTVKMMEAAARQAEEIVLFSGDEAMAPAVRAVQRLGARVTVVFPTNGCSDVLRRAADLHEQFPVGIVKQGTRDSVHHGTGK